MSLIVKHICPKKTKMSLGLICWCKMTMQVQEAREELEARLKPEVLAFLRARGAAKLRKQRSAGTANSLPASPHALPGQSQSAFDGTLGQQCPETVAVQPCASSTPGEARIASKGSVGKGSQHLDQADQGNAMAGRASLLKERAADTPSEPLGRVVRAVSPAANIRFGLEGMPLGLAEGKDGAADADPADVLQRDLLR